jgi:hypothetical protein
MVKCHRNSVYLGGKEPTCSTTVYGRVMKTLFVTERARRVAPVCGRLALVRLRDPHNGRRSV